MYLEARRFVSGYSHSSADERQLYDKVLEAVDLTGMGDERFATVNVNIAYWRKANHIHNWFVDNVQDGTDDCKQYFVSREKLQELEQLCRDVAANGTEEFALEHLPTGSGFFFGGTDYDEYYFESVDWTAKRLAEILMTIPERTDMTGVEFYYQASW
jgi:coenzyme F420-reducing hydrogenase delta subunit